MWPTVDESVESLIEVFGKDQKWISDKKDFIINFIKTQYLRNGENYELLASCKSTDLDEAIQIIFKAFQKNILSRDKNDKV